MLPRGPRRIVCLSDEATEILYGLGESERIVGISAFTRRPPQARRDKPAVSGFADGSVEKIKALRPDLVIGFSDVQAELASRLIREGLAVLVFNQRSIREILETMVSLGQLVSRASIARAWVSRLDLELEQTRQRNRDRARPRVYFEEWPDPMLCGIRWVSELIAIAGGEDVFASRASRPAALERRVSLDELQIVQPQIMLASWCGKPFDEGSVRERPGFDELEFVIRGAIRAIDGSLILQPGPAALSAGLDAICAHLDAWRAANEQIGG